MQCSETRIFNMDPPCPTCGGTEYYCAGAAAPLADGMIAKIIDNVSQLYQRYYSVTGDVAGARIRVEESLRRLMVAWDEYLG